MNMSQEARAAYINMVYSQYCQAAQKEFVAQQAETAEQSLIACQKLERLDEVIAALEQGVDLFPYVAPSSISFI